MKILIPEESVFCSCSPSWYCDRVGIRTPGFSQSLCASLDLKSCMHTVRRYSVTAEEGFVSPTTWSISWFSTEALAMCACWIILSGRRSWRSLTGWAGLPLLDQPWWSGSPPSASPTCFGGVQEQTSGKPGTLDSILYPFWGKAHHEVDEGLKVGHHPFPQLGRKSHPAHTILHDWCRTSRARRTCRSRGTCLLPPCVRLPRVLSTLQPAPTVPLKEKAKPF